MSTTDLQLLQKVVKWRKFESILKELTLMNLKVRESDFTGCIVCFITIALAIDEVCERKSLHSPELNTAPGSC